MQLELAVVQGGPRGEAREECSMPNPLIAFSISGAYISRDLIITLGNSTSPTPTLSVFDS